MQLCALLIEGDQLLERFPLPRTLHGQRYCAGSGAI